jgi:hypothetical protein
MMWVVVVVVCRCMMGRTRRLKYNGASGLNGARLAEASDDDRHGWRIAGFAGFAGFARLC